jgi:hypothetical protein
MSLMKKTDVKNHLSARHRTGIHLIRPESLADATGFPHERAASNDPEAHNSVESSLNVPTSTEAGIAPITTHTSAKA